MEIWNKYFRIPLIIPNISVFLKYIRELPFQSRTCETYHSKWIKAHFERFIFIWYLHLNTIEIDLSNTISVWSHTPIYFITFYCLFASTVIRMFGYFRALQRHIPRHKRTAVVHRICVFVRCCKLTLDDQVAP